MIRFTLLVITAMLLASGTAVATNDSKPDPCSRTGIDACGKQIAYQFGDNIEYCDWFGDIVDVMDKCTDGRPDGCGGYNGERSLVEILGDPGSDDGGTGCPGD